jgi:hypothetical protein
MTRDEFNRMLEDHGFVFIGNDVAWAVAQLVASAERVACAQICYQLHQSNEKFLDLDPHQRPVAQFDADDCAVAILARGDQ